ncbi:MAG TPA: rhomboid family intramembrane serine protease [Capsulimonadaceae bacterium]|jgi:membrane associated rhomboid family serine protease
MPTPLYDLAWILLVFLICPFPIATDRAVRSFPWITTALVAINVVCFLATRSALDGAGDLVATPFDRFGLTPHSVNIPSFISYLFMHENVSHLLWNLGFLWLFGPSVEDALGSWFFAALYFGGGIAAGLLNTATVMLVASTLPVAYTPLIGASGAIAAVLGVYAVRFYRSNIRIYWVPFALLAKGNGIWEAPALVGLALWLAQNIIGAVSSLVDPGHASIAYWAHIGGFVFGVAIAQVGDMLGEGKKEYLMHEARTSNAKGDDKGASEAMTKYRMALQRKPDDLEARRMLAGFAERYPDKASPMRAQLADEYGALIAYCFSHFHAAQGMFWIEQTRILALHPTLPPKTFVALARHLIVRGSPDAAARVYSRLIADFPDSHEAKTARLELAELQLNTLGRPGEATSVLREFVKRENPGACRATRGVES